MSKCIVFNCKNHAHQGKFVGDLCAPCYGFITTGNGEFSQVYRNAISAEREACAEWCESDGAKLDGISCANAIRARGQG